MDNPYQSPEESCTPGWGSPMDPRFRPRGLVGHIRVLAILMIVQGALDLAMGCMLGVMAVAIGPLMSHAEMQQQPNVGPMPEQMFWLVTVIYGGMAVVMLIVAVLHIVAGVQNCRFRGRILGIIAVSSGALSNFTCYCLPTAVALGVYGLIVYLNGPVAEAFRMGEAGCSSSEIYTTFQG